MTVRVRYGERFEPIPLVRRDRQRDLRPGCRDRRRRRDRAVLDAVRNDDVESFDEPEDRRDRDVACRHGKPVVRDLDRVVLRIDDRERNKLIAIIGRYRQRDLRPRRGGRRRRFDRAVRCRRDRDGIGCRRFVCRTELLVCDRTDLFVGQRARIGILAVGERIPVRNDHGRALIGFDLDPVACIRPGKNDGVGTAVRQARPDAVAIAGGRCRDLSAGDRDPADVAGVSSVVNGAAADARGLASADCGDLAAGDQDLARRGVMTAPAVVAAAADARGILAAGRGDLAAGDRDPAAVVAVMTAADARAELTAGCGDLAALDGDRAVTHMIAADARLLVVTRGDQLAAALDRQISVAADKDALGGGQRRALTQDQRRRALWIDAAADGNVFIDQVVPAVDELRRVRRDDVRIRLGARGAVALYVYMSAPVVVPRLVEVNCDVAAVFCGHDVVVARTFRIPCRDRAAFDLDDLDLVADSQLHGKHVLIRIFRIYGEPLRRIQIVDRPAAQTDQIEAVQQRLRTHRLLALFGIRFDRIDRQRFKPDRALFLFDPDRLFLRLRFDRLFHRFRFDRLFFRFRLDRLFFRLRFDRLFFRFRFDRLFHRFRFDRFFFRLRFGIRRLRLGRFGLLLRADAFGFTGFDRRCGVIRSVRRRKGRRQQTEDHQQRHQYGDRFARAFHGLPPYDYLFESGMFV